MLSIFFSSPLFFLDRSSKMAVSLKLSFFCMLFPILAAGILAAHSAPAPAADCSSLVLKMADCLSYVTVGGTAKKPEGTCCSGLKTVLKTDADCLCEAFKNSAQLGVTLNVSKALTLPAACHVSAPSVSNCALNAGHGAAPAPSPLALSPSAIAGGPTAGVGGSEAAPTPTPGSSGSALTTSIVIVFTAVAAVSFALF